MIWTRIPSDLLRRFRYIKAYYTFMVDVAMLLGAKESVAKRDFMDVLKFEIAMAKVYSVFVDLLTSQSFQAFCRY